MMKPWQTGYVEANGIRLHYTRTGGAKPPIILAHGVTNAGPCWNRVAEALAPEYDAIMVDARGHGRSDAPDHDYGPVAQAEDLAGVITALGLNRPAVLGHSMGAASALVLAGLHPDLPGSILLEDPPAWWTGWSATPAANDRHVVMRQRALDLKRKTREELIAAERAEHPGWVDAELEPWADAKHRFSPNVLSVFDQDNASSVDWPGVMRRITCPALLITADPERGAIVNEDHVVALKALVPHLEIVHIPGAGHSIRRDQFARFMDVVRGFLGRQQGQPNAIQPAVKSVECG